MYTLMKCLLKIWLNLCTEHGYTTLFGVSVCFIKISKCFMIFFQWRQRDTNPTNNWKVCYGVPTCPVHELNQIFTRLLAHWHWKLFLPGHCKGVILYREGLIFQKLTTSNNLHFLHFSQIKLEKSLHSSVYWQGIFASNILLLMSDEVFALLSPV